MERIVSSISTVRTLNIIPPVRVPVVEEFVLKVKRTANGNCSSTAPRLCLKVVRNDPGDFFTEDVKVPSRGNLKLKYVVNNVQFRSVLPLYANNLNKSSRESRSLSLPPRKTVRC